MVCAARSNETADRFDLDRSHHPGSAACRYRGNGETMGVVVRRGTGGGASPVVCCCGFMIGRGGGGTAVLACAFNGDVLVIMRIIWS